MKTSRRPSRGGVAAAADCDAIFPSSTGVAVLFLLVVLQIVSNTDQAAAKFDVVRVVRVDVPPVVRSYDAKPDVKQQQQQQQQQPPPPLLLGCAYALQGGENDDENGDVRPTNATPTATVAARGAGGPPEVAMDAAVEEVQRQRGLVVKWYFRRNPAPAAAADDAMAIIHDNEQVYQWMAGGGPEASGGLGPLSGRVVDVSGETPRADKSALHRVIRVDRPTAELTGEYRCQVEDWNTERRSAWHPMVVYTPERIFKVFVDDNDDDDEDDIAEGSGSVDGNFTTGAPSTSNPPSVRKNLPTEINITCYAAGMHPEPSMSIWVNGMMQDSVTVSVTEDDGDDDERNDANMTSTTTTTTTTAKPKTAYRNRYRNGGGGGGDGDGRPREKYAIRASKVVSLKDVADDEERRAPQTQRNRRRGGVVEVECRLRVPGDGTGGGRWDADRAADRYYGARRSVAYRYRGGGELRPSSGNAFAAVSSASSVVSDGRERSDDAGGRDADGGGARFGRPSAASLLFAVCFAAAAAAVPR